MDDDMLIILFVIIFIILFYYYYQKRNESFEKLNDEQKCDIVAQPKFMVKDLRTNLWLKVDAEYYKFVPGNFGTLFLLNETHNDNLPLRLLTNPNFYILISDDKKNIRIVKNPYDKFYRLEIFIYNNMNILGYLDQNNNNNYIFIDNNGGINSVDCPSKASSIEVSRI
jgi:hypothetical protein